MPDYAPKLGGRETPFSASSRSARENGIKSSSRIPERSDPNSLEAAVNKSPRVQAMAQLRQSIHQSPRVQAMAQSRQSIHQSLRVQAMARLRKGVVPVSLDYVPRRKADGAGDEAPRPHTGAMERNSGSSAVQRVIEVKSGEEYTAAADLPQALQADPLLRDLANSADTALAQSVGELTRHADGQTVSILMPRRHLIGENHDDSHFDEAVDAWGWGAAKMQEGFQTSGSVRDPHTQNWLHPGFWQSKTKVGTEPLEDVHARMLQDIALYRTHLEYLSQEASNLSTSVGRSLLTERDKTRYNSLRAAGEGQKGNLLVRLKGYEEACKALLTQDAALDTRAQSALRIMATTMADEWDTLPEQMKAAASSPWNLFMADSGDFAVANRLSAKSQAAAAVISRLDLLASLTIAVLKAEDHNPQGTDAAADIAWGRVTQGGNPLTEVSPVRELFMRQRVNAMRKPGLVGMGAQHVTNLTGQIDDGEYYGSYNAFRGAIQMKEIAPVRASGTRVLQGRWQNDTSIMTSQEDLQGLTGVAPGTVAPGSAADVSLTSGADYLVAPNAVLAVEANSPAVNALPPGKHIVGESRHGGPEWESATASWPYIPKMRERLKTYAKPHEVSIGAADRPWETHLRKGSTDLALEGHNEYAITTLSVLQQYLKGYDQIDEYHGPDAARYKAEKFQELHERSEEAYLVLLRLRQIGVALSNEAVRTPGEEQYYQMALHIDINKGYQQIKKIADDKATGYVTTLGGFWEKNFLKNIYDIEDLINDVVPRIVTIDNFQNMQAIRTLNEGRHRDLADWNNRAGEAITSPASRDIREFEMMRRINAAPSPLLVQVGTAHIPGLRAKGAAGTLYDDEWSLQGAAQKNTFNFG
jgi:hypothetical protein